jgi:hypothetical protein
MTRLIHEHGWLELHPLQRLRPVQDQAGTADLPMSLPRYLRVCQPGQRRHGREVVPPQSFLHATVCNLRGQVPAGRGGGNGRG